MVDFANTPRSVELTERLRRFIDDEVRPVEADVAAARAAHPTQQPVAVKALKERARTLGLWNLCVRDPDLGPGLSMVEYAPMAEAMGTSRLAQEATNCDAPSSVNGDALALYGSPSQKERWLEPQLAGLTRSAFAMTEPHTASSDASNIAMTAERAGTGGDAGWVLNGRKWWISGVLHPNCAYLMAVAATSTGTGTGTDQSDRHRRHSQFIVPRHADGLTVVRDLSKFGYHDADGHTELEFDNVRVPADSLLGEVGGGFAIGRARLGSARVQHCMRTIGVAEQALALMCQRAEERTTFGQPVATRANVMDWIALARIDIDAARLKVMHTAWLMDTQGNKAAAPEMSAIKVLVMRTATTVVDRAIQVFGAAGVSDDTPLARAYASLRALRIADGPDEVHLMAIGRRELRQQAARATSEERAQ